MTASGPPREDGIGEGSKIGFITCATFFPMFVTTVHGVAQIDGRLLRAARSLGYTRILEDVDPALVKWKAKTEVK